VRDDNRNPPSRTSNAYGMRGCPRCKLLSEDLGTLIVKYWTAVDDNKRIAVGHPDKPDAETMEHSCRGPTECASILSLATVPSEVAGEKAARYTSPCRWSYPDRHHRRKTWPCCWCKVTCCKLAHRYFNLATRKPSRNRMRHPNIPAIPRMMLPSREGPFTKASQGGM
jgi:hypothetical protein